MKAHQCHIWVQTVWIIRMRFSRNEDILTPPSDDSSWRDSRDSASCTSPSRTPFSCLLSLRSLSVWLCCVTVSSGPDSGSQKGEKSFHSRPERTANISSSPPYRYVPAHLDLPRSEDRCSNHGPVNPPRFFGPDLGYACQRIFSKRWRNALLLGEWQPCQRSRGYASFLHWPYSCPSSSTSVSLRSTPFGP